MIGQGGPIVVLVVVRVAGNNCGILVLVQKIGIAGGCTLAEFGRVDQNYSGQRLRLSSIDVDLNQFFNWRKMKKATNKGKFRL